MKSLVKADEALMAQWQEVAPKPATSNTYNRIFIDNAETTEVDGKTAINEDFGSLFSEKEGVKEKIDITKAEFFPALHRTQVRTPFDAKTQKSKYFCRETDDLQDIHIFDASTKQLVENGNFFDLREKYGLKTKEVIYVVYNGDIYRWVLTAGGWEKVKVLTEMIRKAHAPMLFRVAKIEKKKNSDGRAFNSIDFEKVREMTTAEELQGAIETVKKIKQTLTEYYDNVANEDMENTLNSVFPIE